MATLTNDFQKYFRILMTQTILCRAQVKHNQDSNKKLLQEIIVADNGQVTIGNAYAQELGSKAWAGGVLMHYSSAAAAALE